LASETKVENQIERTCCSSVAQQEESDKKEHQAGTHTNRDKLIHRAGKTDHDQINTLLVNNKLNTKSLLPWFMDKKQRTPQPRLRSKNTREQKITMAGEKHRIS
jgi:hypothetical protein